MTSAPRFNNRSVANLFRIALFLAVAGITPLALSETDNGTETPSVATGEPHSQMHSMAALDAPDYSEVDDSALVVSANSPVAVSVSNFAFSPATVTVPQGQTVRWDFQDNTVHTATDTTAMALFDSGQKTAGESFSFLFRSAGIYPYHCEIHSSMTGAVQVPLKVTPSSGTATTAFTITWSSVAAPAGFVFDAQIRRPGSSSFVNWKMGRTSRSATFTPGAGPGKYSFRARLRRVSNGAHSIYSPFRTVTVQ